MARKSNKAAETVTENTASEEAVNAEATEAAAPEYVLSRTGRGAVKPLNNAELTDYAFDVEHAKAGAKHRYTVTIDGAAGEAATTAKAAVASAIKANAVDPSLYDCDGAAKAIEWLSVGHNSAPSEADWTANDKVAELRAYQAEAVEAVEAIKGGETTLRVANRKLGKIVASVRAMLSNERAFGAWVRDGGSVLAGRLTGKNSGAEYAFLGMYDDELFSTLPDTTASPKAVELAWNNWKQEIASGIAQRAFIMAKDGGKARPNGTMASQAFYDCVMEQYDRDALETARSAVKAGFASPQPGTDNKVHNVIRYGRLAELFLAAFGEDGRKLQTVAYSDENEKYELLTGNESAPILPAFFKVGRASSHNELLVAYVKALNAEVSKEAKAKEAVKVQADKAEKESIAAIVRGFADFSVQEAALHLLGILRCRYDGEGADANDVYNALGGLMDRIEAGETFEQIKADIDAAKSAAEAEAEAEKAEADAEDQA